jgi:class 3 adenylate cyclase
VTTPPAADIERRRATVMFVDILGATELSSRAGIEQAYAIVTGCLRVLDAVARRHGGVVDKYLSDCIMAVFGVPIASAEAPGAAVAAAIEMLDAAARYGADVDSPIPLVLRIGVNTGLMVAGDLRGPVVREFAVMGDAVNVAARLKDVGLPGNVHVGPETYEAARARFLFEAGEPLALRGKTERVAAHRALGPRRGIRCATGGPRRASSTRRRRPAPASGRRSPTRWPRSRPGARAARSSCAARKARASRGSWRPRRRGGHSRRHRRTGGAAQGDRERPMVVARRPARGMGGHRRRRRRD